MPNANAPVLSKKQQNKSVANKKKALKTIKNVITCPEAVFWPTLKSENEIEEVVKSLYDISPIDNSKEEGEKQKKEGEKRKKEGANRKKDGDKLKFDRNVIKFGVNEISRSITNGSCRAILFDDAVPRIVVLHILSLAKVKCIPVLCIPSLNVKLKERFGFSSSSVGFALSPDEGVCGVCQRIVALFDKYYKPDPIETEEVIKTHNETLKDNVSKKIDSISPISNVTLKLNEKLNLKKKKDSFGSSYIKLGESRKRKLVFQPLLIKKVCPNTNRKNKDV